MVATTQIFKLLLLLTNGWLMVNNDKLPAFPTDCLHLYGIFGILNRGGHKLASVNHCLNQSKSAAMTSRGPVSIHGLETADVPETDPSLTFNMQEIGACEGLRKHPEHLINNTYQNCW